MDEKNNIESNGNENGSGTAETSETETPTPEVKFTFLNNDGGSGFAESKAREGGTTIEEFLADENVDSNRFQIRVRTKAENGTKQTLTPTGDYEIKTGDFITCVPLKAGGAA